MVQKYHSFDASNKKLEEEKLNAIKDPEKKYRDLKIDFEKLQSNLSIKDKEIEDLESSINFYKDIDNMVNTKIWISQKKNTQLCQGL